MTNTDCTTAPLTECCRALYVAADALVPSSTLQARHILQTCGQMGADAKCCPSASMPLPLSTARWGDVSSEAFGPPNGKADVLDIPAVFNKLKGVPTCVPPCSFIFPEHRAWLKQNDPIPNLDAILVTDLADVIDAGGFGKDYPAARAIDSCSHDPIICP